MQPYDRGSKWLIQHHGDAILRIAGLADIASWRALAAEVIQPRKLPDGLIEARRAGRTEPDLFVLELMTYPDLGLIEQVVRDQALVYLDRRTLPEVLVLVLHPRGQLRTAESTTVDSPMGWSSWDMRWRVVELWTIPAEDLLALGDVGVVPWVPLGRIDGPPGPVLRRCRERIDREAPADERENLLAVAQVFAGLRYNDPALIGILGGREAMIESPILQELKAEWSREAARAAAREARQQDLLDFLDARFGSEAEGLAGDVRALSDEAQLADLVRFAAVCPDLDAFRARLGPRP